MNSTTARRRFDAADVACSEAMRSFLTKRRLARRGAIIAARSADGWCVLPLLLGLAALCDPPARRRVLILAVGVIVTGILVYVLKQSVRRSRPEGEWGGSYRRADPHSFPSGHAARVGAIATFSAMVCPPALTLVVVLWAAAVASSRIALGVHYLSDILAGLALGVATGMLTAMAQ